MLEIMKMLLSIETFDTSKDDLLNHFIKQALKAALAYCNVTEIPPESQIWRFTSIKIETA